MKKWLTAFLFVSIAHFAYAAAAGDFLGKWTWVYRTGGGQAIDVTLELPALSGGLPAGTFHDHFGPHTIQEVQLQGDTLKFTVYYDSPGIDDVPVWMELSLNGSMKTTERNFAPSGGYIVKNYSATHILQPGGTRPVITQDPINSTVTKGGSATFTVQATGSSPLTYQWLKGDQSIGGANSATLILENVSEADAGDYACSVADSAGTTLSNRATLTVKTIIVVLEPKITILSAPVSTTATVGGTASFTVVATAEVPLFYQWLKNGVAIPGATNSTLTLTNVQHSDAATFNCSITQEGSGGALMTSPFTTLSVVGPPLINAQPAGVNVIEGQSFSLTTTALGGSGSISFKWNRGSSHVWTSGGVIGIPPAPSTSTYVVASSKPSDAGEYYCVVENSAGTTTTQKVIVTVQPVPKPPTITVQPSAVAVTEGKPLTLSTTATTAAGTLRFRWHRNGVATSVSHTSDAGTFTSTYSVASSSFGDAGDYTCVVENEVGQVISQAAAVVVDRAARIVNLSSRAMTGGVAGAPISGFVIVGGGQLPVLVRAIGPTLGAYGVSTVVADPVLRILSGNQEIESNDNWLSSQSQTFVASGAFALVADSKDAAAVKPLGAGSYTVMAQDALGRAGVLLAETYDSSPLTSNARFVNASTRGYVGTGEQSMVTGFVVMGKGTVRLLVRAIGPTLKSFGVGDAIADPMCELFKGDTKLRENDNWESGTGAAEIPAANKSVGAFDLNTGSKDAAMVVSLTEGNYSVVTSGTNSTTGTVLIELYLLP